MSVEKLAKAIGVGIGAVIVLLVGLIIVALLAKALAWIVGTPW